MPGLRMKGTGRYKYFYIMNKDIHLMFEAYQQHLSSKKEHCTYAAKGCECDGCEECMENASMEGVMSGYGKSGEISAEQEDAEYGVDPKEAKVYDDAKKDISYQNYAAWDAYHAVKEGAWSEDDFLQWTRSVWADGADDMHNHESEEVTEGKHSKKHIFTKVEKAAEKAGYSKKAAEKIAGAAKAKAL